jgi:NAD(P)-dependent dehydrogenase (short-subunit alcohol dehydrogenase family)
MKIILVTGGNRGIGFEICKQLDVLGHSVIMGSRDFEKGLKAAEKLSNRVVVKQLDVTDGKSIRSVLDFVRTEFGHLDVLINNAGINSSSQENHRTFLSKAKGALEDHIPGIRKVTSKIVPALKNAGIISKPGNVKEIDLDEVQQVMETNLYGAWLMIQAFTPLLESSVNGRIINMSSGMGEMESLAGDYAGYRVSKTALNALTIMFARELERTGISVNAMCPGWVKTDMGGPNAPLTVSQGADTAVWLATEKHIPTGKFFRDRTEINW